MVVPELDDIASTWETWIAGYAYLRQLRFEATDHGWWLDVGRRQQSGRYLLRDGDLERVRHLAGSIDDPAVHIEVPLPRGHLEGLRPAGWTLGASEFLMTVRARPFQIPSLPDGVQLVLDPDAEIRAGCLDKDGHALSRGICAVFGNDAIFDQIVTEAPTRRQGLGTAVMGVLMNEALRRGGTRGVLVATGEGRPFYEGLGWTVLSEISRMISPSQSRSATHLRIVSGR